MQNQQLQEISQQAHSGNWIDAQNSAQAYVAQHPNDAEGWYYYAQVEKHLGKIGEARKALGKADAIDPNHSYTTNNRAYDSLAQTVYGGSQGANTQGTTQEHHVVTTQTVTTTPLVTTPVVHPVVQQHSSGHGVFVFLGITLVIVAIIALIVSIFKNSRQPAIVTVTAPQPVVTNGSVSTGVVQSGGYGASRVVSSPAPVVAGGGGQTVVVQGGGGVGPGYGYGYGGNGMLEGMLMGEMLADANRPYYAGSPMVGGVIEQPVMAETVTTTTTDDTYVNNSNDFDDGDQNDFDSGNSGSQNDFDDGDQNDFDSGSNYDNDSSFDSGNSGGDDSSF